MRVRPGGLTAVAVISIVLGVMGLLTTLLMVVGMAIEGAKFTQFQAGQGMQKQTPEQIEAMKKLTEDARQVGVRWRIPRLALLVVYLPVGFGLVVGGVMTYGLNPTGRKLLAAALLLAIVGDAAGSAVGMGMQRDLAPIQHDIMTTMMTGKQAQLGNSMADMTEMMTNVMTGVKGLWLFALIAFYITGFVYLRRPAIVSLCENRELELPIDPWNSPR